MARFSTVSGIFVVGLIMSIISLSASARTDLVLAQQKKQVVITAMVDKSRQRHKMGWSLATCDTGIASKAS